MCDVGSLLKISCVVSGISIKTMKSIKIAFHIEPGIYLVLDEFSEETSNNKFIEILYKKNIVLLNKHNINTKQ